MCIVIVPQYTLDYAWLCLTYVDSLTFYIIATHSFAFLFMQIPDSMLGRNGTDLVLGTCPCLHSLSLTFTSHYTDHVITSLACDLPSLEGLEISRCASLETLSLTCPKLVNLGISDCPKLSLPSTLMAQLTTFSGHVSLLFKVMCMHGSTTHCKYDDVQNTTIWIRWHKVHALHKHGHIPWLMLSLVEICA